MTDDNATLGLVFDRAAAEKFLSIIGRGATRFTFQCFDDNKERREALAAKNKLRKERGERPLPSPFVRVLHGSLDQHFDELARLNRAGAGVFVTINETDLRGRTAKNIIKVRALFLDLDGNPLPVDEKEAHVVVETSPGHWHVYWLVDDVPLDGFTPRQKALIARHGGDKSINYLNCVLRLPGFLHRKQGPRLVRIVEVNDLPPYRADEFPPATEDHHRGHRVEFGNGEPDGDVDLEAIEWAMTELPNPTLEEVGGDAEDPRYFDRDRWLTVCMSLHHTFDGTPHGFRPLEAWTVRNPNYDNAEARTKAAAIWASFDGRPPGPPSKVRKYTAATIYYYADQTAPGWRDRYHDAAAARVEAANRDDEQHARYLAEIAARSGSPETISTNPSTDAKPDPGGANTDDVPNGNTIADDEPDATTAPKASAKPTEAAKPKPSGGGKLRANLAASAAAQVVVVRASDVAPRAKDWIWKGNICRGAVELMTGLPGIGKSQVHCDFVARATTGGGWPNGGAAVAAMNVIMVTAEDALDQEVVPRLIAAGADRARVHIVKAIKTDARFPGRQFLLGEDLTRLEGKMKEIGDVGLVTIDPITAYMGAKIDSHKTTDVRSQLGPLKDFAETNNVAVSCVTHPAKNAGPSAINHFIGSQAFIAAARIGHFCCEEVDEEERPTGRVLFTNPKNNADARQPTLAYRRTAIVIDARYGENIAAPRVTWDEGTVDISPDAAVAQAAASRRDGRSSEQRECQAFLKTLLGDGAPRLEKEVEAEGERHGFSVKQLRRAKDKIGAESRKDETIFEGRWFWVLPF